MQMGSFDIVGGGAGAPETWLMVASVVSIILIGLVVFMFVHVWLKTEEGSDGKMVV